MISCVCEDREVILSESVYLQFWAHWVLRAVFLAGFCSNMSEVLYEISVRNTEPSAKMHKVPLIWMLSGQNTLHVRFLPCATWAGMPQLFAWSSLGRSGILSWSVRRQVYFLVHNQVDLSVWVAVAAVVHQPLNLLFVLPTLQQKVALWALLWSSKKRGKGT